MTFVWQCYPLQKGSGNRASKVYFKLVQTLNPKPSVSILTHLFDHMIKPVLHYGCEVLTSNTVSQKGVTLTGDRHTDFFKELKRDFPIISTILDKDSPLEKLHLKFCKFALGVHQKTSNLGVLGELGRFPIAMEQLLLSAKYFYHIRFNTENKILREVYENLTEQEPGICQNNLFGHIEKLHLVLGIAIPEDTRKTQSTIHLLRKTLQARFECY